MLSVLIFISLLSFFPYISVKDLQIIMPYQPPLYVPFSLANFGQIPYGSHIIAPLKLSTNNTLCSPIYSHSHSKQQAVPTPFVLLAVRGNCSFMSKAYTAQALGASMLIIVDNVLENTENITPMAESDDDDTSDLLIPTLFIAKNDGDPLLMMAQNSSIIVNVSLNMTKSDNVNYTFWLSNSQPQTLKLVASFKDYFEIIEDSKDVKVGFEAHYIGLFHCKFCNFTNYSYFPDNCISGGRYCSSYPENSNSSIGVYYIYEDLRQLCIYKTSKSMWWKYMSKFLKTCQNRPEGYQACSKLILQNLEFKHNLRNFTHKINQCFNDSFIKTENEDYPDPLLNDNILLSEERKISIDKAIGFWPSVTINDEAYKGSLTGNAVFLAICEAFIIKPRFCVYEEITENFVNENIIWMVLMMIAFIIAIVLIIYCTKYKKVKASKTRALEISEIIGKYHILHEKREKINNKA